MKTKDQDIAAGASSAHPQRGRKRGNPNWGKPEPLISPPTVSAFESFVNSLGLTPEEYGSSSALREWARRNCQHKYVPPNLLELWGFEPSFEI